MEKELLQQLYETYGKEIYLYLFSLCGNHEMAEDLRQEIFVKALLSLQNSHSNMRAWLYLVARNTYFNEQKKGKRQIVQEESVMQVLMEKGQGFGNDPILSKVIKEEENRTLYQAMLLLSGKKREVLQLQYFGGLSLKEIATILQMTPENVRVLSHRAKLEMRKIMKEDEYDIS